MSADIHQREWDCIIVGTGMGGATLGYALARAGWRVLFCEQGNDTTCGGRSGDYAETYFDRPDYPQDKHRDVLQQAGRWAESLIIEQNGRSHRHMPFIGCGTGGSSALYGMALERFFPEDFEPARHHPGHNSTLPERWPIRYQELAPYYVEAEALFGVRGSVDPLKADQKAGSFGAPPPLSSLNRELFEHFQDKGLHPYQIPLACRFVEGCACCQGYLCSKECKIDAATACLTPALRDFGATLLDRCTVTRLHTDGQRVDGVECLRDGQRFTLRAPLVILAAGALNTPRILLQSASEQWPSGVANRSGLVGRNLMHHYTDLYVLTPRGRGDNRMKQIAFNDLYLSSEGKLGTVQSFGRLPPPGILAESLKADIAKSPFSALQPLYGMVKPGIRRVLGGMVEHSVVLATIVEDLPYADNQVQVVDGKIHIRYQTRPEELGRIRLMRSKMAKLLSPYAYKLIKQAENPELIAHACGTCRAGDNPDSSVVDRNNRCHDLPNLYIVDSAFFPSSGGTNPSLTIAANALRVARHLIENARQP